jgi:hypothetical protein
MVMKRINLDSGGATARKGRGAGNGYIIMPVLALRAAARAPFIHRRPDAAHQQEFQRWPWSARRY